MKLFAWVFSFSFHSLDYSIEFIVFNSAKNSYSTCRNNSRVRSIDEQSQHVTRSCSEEQGCFVLCMTAAKVVS